MTRTKGNGTRLASVKRRSEKLSRIASPQAIDWACCVLKKRGEPVKRLFAPRDPRLLRSVSAQKFVFAVIARLDPVRQAARKRRHQRQSPQGHGERYDFSPGQNGKQENEEKS